MFDIVAGLLGSHDDAADWLISRRAVATPAPDRAAADEVVRLMRAEEDDRGWPDEVVLAGRARAAALAAYCAELPTGCVVVDSALESLLHMHSNRALGIDRDSEDTCRRLTRHAALAYRAQTRGAGR